MTSIPSGITPVANFDLQRYLGAWYEIARLDHKFERGLQGVTANYSVNPDDSVKVVNSGVATASGERDTATGVAHFVGDVSTGHLKVSFFGPFYGSYIIFALDQQNYRYSMVAGPSRQYLWLLSRTPEMDNETYQGLLQIAQENGYNTSKLIVVEH